MYFIAIQLGDNMWFLGVRLILLPITAKNVFEQTGLSFVVYTVEPSL